MLFSATMPGPIVALARHVPDPADPDPGRARRRAHRAPTHVDQFAYRAHAMDKAETARPRAAGPRPRPDADLHPHQAHRGEGRRRPRPTAASPPRAVHGDLGQGAREQALRAFRSGKVDVLVATDVAARGLDVEGITHVINYQAPEDEMTYVHRIGRTARAGASGHRDHARRLGRHPALEADLRQARPAVPRAGRDLLDLPAPLPRAGHPGGCDRRAAARRPHPGRPGRRTARGPRRAGFPGARNGSRDRDRGARDVLEPAESAAARVVTAGRRAAAGRTASREPGAIGAHANAPDVGRHRAARTPTPAAGRPAGSSTS